MEKVIRKTKNSRPEKLTEAQKDLVVNHFNNGDTQKEISIQFNVSLSTIRRILKQRSI